MLMYVMDNKNMYLPVRVMSNLATFYLTSVTWRLTVVDRSKTWQVETP